MNERVPDSTGLPLRAIVMVLLFLGVVFLLLGFQAAGSSSGDEESSGSASTSTSATSSAAEEPDETSAEASPEPEARPEVHVFNISDVDGAADRTAGQLRDNGVDVTSTGNMPADTAPQTTVFYPDEPGAQELADQIGGILGGAPVELRTEAMADQPPGVLVVVTG